MENAELLAKITKEIMHDYFQGNPETWFQYLDSRCVFVATEETILSGIENIKHELQSHLKKGRGNILSDEYFHIPLSKKVTVVIAYTISESREENDLQVVNLISFIWQMKGKEPKIVYEHASYRFYEEEKKNTILATNQRDIFQHVPIIFQKPVKPDSMGVPGFSPFGDVHMSFRIPPRLDARE